MPLSILALDLGTKTGWALFRDGVRTSGTWLLATEKELGNQRKRDKDRCCDLRFGRLQDYIKGVGPIDWVYFEDVQFLSSQLQAQLWSGFRTVVSLMYPMVQVRAVPVGTLKKFATGKGNSKKDEMGRALLKQTQYTAPSAELFEKGIYVVERETGRPVDDNEVDALHLLEFARAEIK